MLLNRVRIFVIFFAISVVSLGIQDVGDVPARVVYSSPNDEVGIVSLETTVDPTDDLPETEAKVILPVAWIKEYLDFKCNQAQLSLVEENKPLKSKFTNFERTMSDDEDLRSWTRYIIDHDRDETQTTKAPIEEEMVDLKIDEFISFLVDYKGFNSEDLQFLHRPDLDYGYEQIETELSRIHELERHAQKIKVWGEVLGATRSCCLRTSFLITFVVVATSACLFSF